MTPLHLLYIIGEPGVGKSTTMQALTAGLARVYVAAPLHHEFLTQQGNPATIAVELGRTREGFPGTDTLALNANPKAIDFVSWRPAPIVLAEGDRLANMAFLEGARQAGYRVHVAWLTAGAAVPAARRAERGSNQNEAWLRGRQTKVRNLAATAARVGMEVLAVDTGNRTPAQVVNTLRGAWPFLDAIPREEVPV